MLTALSVSASLPEWTVTSIFGGIRRIASRGARVRRGAGRGPAQGWPATHDRNSWLRCTSDENLKGAGSNPAPDLSPPALMGAQGSGSLWGTLGAHAFVVRMQCLGWRLPSECVAIATRVARTANPTRFPIRKNALNTADLKRPRAERFNLVPAGLKRVARRLWHSGFHPHDARRQRIADVIHPPEAWRCDGVLEVQPEIDEVHEYLNSGHENPIRARCTNRAPELPVSEKVKRRNRPLMTFARLDDVRVAGCHREPVHAVVQAHPRMRNDNATAERIAQTVRDVNG